MTVDINEIEKTKQILKDGMGVFSYEKKWLGLTWAKNIVMEQKAREKCPFEEGWMERKRELHCVSPRF